LSANRRNKQLADQLSLEGGIRVFWKGLDPWRI
jgi:hypothetical protein